MKPRLGSRLARANTGARFFRASALAISAKLFSAITAFLVAPRLLELLGAPTFGLWALMYTVSAYTSLFEFGVTTTATVEVATAMRKGDWLHVRAAIRRGITVILAITVVMLIAVLSVNATIIQLLPRDVGAVRGVSLLLPATVCGWAIQRVGAVLATILDTQGRLVTSQVVPLAAQGAMPILALMGVSLGAEAYGLSGALVVAPAIGSTVVSWSALRELSTHPTVSVGRRRLPTAWSVTGQLQLTTMADAINFNTDRLLVASLVSLSAVATYELAARVASIVHVLLLTPQSLLFPILAAAANPAERQRRADVAGAAVQWAAGFLAAGALVTADTLVALWLGAPSPDVALLVRMLSCAFAVHAVTGPYTAEMRAAQSFRPAALFAVCAAALNVVLTVLLGLRYGLFGIVSATVISLTLASLTFIAALPRYGHGHAPLVRTVKVAFATGISATAVSVMPAPTLPIAELIFRSLAVALTFAVLILLTDSRVRHLVRDL